MALRIARTFINRRITARFVAQVEGLPLIRRLISLMAGAENGSTHLEMALDRLN